MNSLISKSNLPKFFDKVISRCEVIAPVLKNGVLAFSAIKTFSEIDLTRQSDYPAKKYLLPARETLFKYNKDRPEQVSDAKNRVLVIRPCDANALVNMDKIFLADPPDNGYAERRKNTRLFVFKCTEPYENCFCTSVSSSDTTNYDLLFTEVGDKYIVSAGTCEGKEFLDGRLFSDVLRDGWLSVDCRRKLASTDKLTASFDSPAWQEHSEKCLSCNACIIACPTCYCFTIKDEPSLDLLSGARNRMWDYCHMQCHTRVAGGFVFRNERHKRFRHRILHQLKYYKDRHGKHLCVGCGRCINICPTKIDMVEIVNSL